jgi:hypothetical protein
MGFQTLHQVKMYLIQVIANFDRFLAQSKSPVDLENQVGKIGCNGTCIKRWGLRASSLSAVAKVDAGQNASHNHLAPMFYT